MPQDIGDAAREAADARAHGGFTAKAFGMEHVLWPGTINPLLDSIVKARGGTGGATAADSQALRGAMQGIVDVYIGANQPKGNGPAPGPNQSHDITVHPAMGLAGAGGGRYGPARGLSRR